MATIELNPQELAAEAQSESAMAHGRVPVILSLSVYDIPRSATVEHDRASDTVRIQFQYMDRESPIRRDAADIVFSTGQNSGKLLGIEVKHASQRPIILRIVEGVDAELNRSKLRDNERLNYKLIRKVVTGKLGPLLTTTESA